MNAQHLSQQQPRARHAAPPLRRFHRKRWTRAGVAAAVATPVLIWAPLVPAEASDPSLIKNVQLEHSGIFCVDPIDKSPNHGGDMAFFGRRMVLACGSDDSTLENDGFVILDITHAEPKLLGRFDCVASASDIAFWDDLVFLAVDSNNDTRPSGQQLDGRGLPRPLFSGPAKAAPKPGVPEWGVDTCDAEVVADDGEGSVFKGVRIVSIADPAAPQLLASIDLPDEPGSNPATQKSPLTDNNPLREDETYEEAVDSSREVNDRQVGVHNITLRPLRQPSGEVDTVRLYLNDPEGVVNHALDVPVGNPTAFKPAQPWRPTSDTGNTNPATACHDLAVFEPAGIGACSRGPGGTALIDLTTGASPGHIFGRDLASVSHENRDLQQHHSGAFSYDGSTLFLSDEPLQSLALKRCARKDDPHYGALWAFSTAPKVKGGTLAYRGHILPPPVDDTDFCSSKQFNVIPMDNERDVLVVAWAAGGTSVVEWNGATGTFDTLASFTDRRGPRDTWSTAWASHWYNGRIYVNNTRGCFFGREVCVGSADRGLDVLTLDKSLHITDHAVRQKRYGFATQECLPLTRHPDASAALCPPEEADGAGDVSTTTALPAA